MPAATAESAVSDGMPADRSPSGERPDDPGPLAPPRPISLQDAGLTVSQLGDFILKLLYFNGRQSGHEIERELRLPLAALEEVLRYLEDQRCLNVTSDGVLEPASRQFVLTDLGRVCARDALSVCRYLGPAPVPLSSYVLQCGRQSPVGSAWTDEQFRTSFQHLVIPPDLLAELGTAVWDGRSILLYGPSGNGKTVIGCAVGKLLSSHGGEIYVPYAILVDDSVVTVFDPAIHQTTDDHLPDDGPLNAGVAEAEVDLRWRRIRRPVVMAGGELTLDMLDLRQHASGRLYTAPLHVKSNGGVLLIDDFGRQTVGPEELLNRWILPLEDGIDYLSLAGGRRVALPIQQLVIFLTNLNPHDLVDEALLRRIRHKIQASAPSQEVFAQIFRNCCHSRDLTFDRQYVETLFERHYNRHRLPRSSDPHDLLEMVTTICRYRGEEPRLDAERLRMASERFFRDA